MERTTAPVYNEGGLVAPGTGGVNWSPNALHSIQGFTQTRKQQNALRMVQIAECAALWNRFLVNGDVNPFLMQEAVKGGTEDWVFPKLNKLAPHIFNEAMGIGDFTNLTTYALDRLLMQNYPEVPNTYTQVCKVNNSIRDFRAVERWQVDGGEGPWQPVQEFDGFLRGKESTAKYSYSVGKYAKGDQISWEAIINDDMGQFNDLPSRLAIGGVRTVEQYYLNLIADANGPHASFYGTAIALVNGGTVNNKIDTSAYGGAVNPPLTIQNLILAVGAFMNMMTAEGRPIDIAGDQLNVVVADGILYQTLKNIINTNQIATTILGGSKASSAVTADITAMARNWISGNINPIYAPELRNIVTTSGRAASSWWLFAKPGAARPAIELGFMKGFGSPQLYRKASNTESMGGGGRMEQMGDFETMSTEFKGVIVFGGTRMDPRMTMASNGTSS